MEKNEAGIPVRELGRTGLAVSIVGFGGGHCVRPDIDEKTTVRLIQEAIDAGVTFMDNAWEYAGGESERRMGDRPRRPQGQGRVDDQGLRPGPDRPQRSSLKTASESCAPM